MSTGVIKAKKKNERPVFINIGRLAQDYFPEIKKKNRRLIALLEKKEHV
ncbi:hypothetical protein [Peribacillus simplex]|uniref:Uncharacterized protein n=1 Tax=Peribacillus simplex TaxID=1478 RepID=A0AAW7I7L6_9BACI|nr:hypothetical protein [Peribacillus simplex]MDM5451174.1 hypothetical protein [Peribacillus simplex]